MHVLPAPTATFDELNHLLPSYVPGIRSGHLGHDFSYGNVSGFMGCSSVHAPNIWHKIGHDPSPCLFQIYVVYVVRYIPNIFFKEIVEFKKVDPLLSKVLDGLQWNGIKNPLPIQAQALPLVLSGLDVIGIAQTGSWANFEVQPQMKSQELSKVGG